MTTYVLAHGEVRTEFGNVKTFGKRVRAYSEVDSYLVVSNGIATVSNGGNGQAAGTFEGDTEIPVGWHFTTVEDEIMQLFLSAVVDEGELKMVGDKLPGDLWMCMDPASCIAAARHTCTGLLGQVDDDDIVIIACRGISGSTTTKADQKLSLGSEAPDGDFDEALTAKVNELVEMYNRDPDEFGAEWDQLPQGTMATLSAWPVIRQAADLSWKISEQKQGELTALVASDPAAAIQYYDALPAFEQARMGTYKELRDWVAERDRQVGAQEDFETGAAEAWVPTDQELSYIAQTNKDNVKATGDEESVGFVQAGFVTLIGDGHDAEYVDWVNSQSDYASGSITVYKGGVFSSGKFEVSGCPPAGQGILEANVARFSDKDVEFV